MIGVQNLDLVPRYHHVPADHVVELKHRIDQTVFAFGQMPKHMGFSQDRANVFFTVWSAMTGLTVQAQLRQNDVGDPTQYPHEREQNDVEKLHRQRTPADHLGRFTNRKDFRRLFAHDQVQRCDD